MSTISDIIAAAAQRRGVDPRALTGIARIESGLNPNARNPSSSAGGLFQFIDSTAQRYGLTNKFDAAASADAAARLTADNAGTLFKNLGRQPTPGELYLAHQQGAGGALKLLSQPDAPAAQVVGQKAFSLNGGVPGMTAAQFAQKWTGKLDGAMSSDAAGPAVPGPAAGVGVAPTGTLAQALPGASLPVFNAPDNSAAIAAALTPPPVDNTAALREQQAKSDKEARRRALLSIGQAFG